VRWLRHIWKRDIDYREIVSHPVIDIHTHILPGLDDGVRTCADAVAMAQHAAAAGVTHIVATPHYNSMFKPGHEAVRKRLQELTAALQTAGSNITLMAGREVSFTDCHIEDLKADTALHFPGGKKYVLIEIAEGLTRATLIEGVFALMTAGILPVIAHPERSSLVIKNPALAEELRERGALLQLDAASLLRAHGRRSMTLAKKLIDRQQVDIISSDAHRTEHYQYFMQACRYIFARHGEEYFNDVTCKTPAKIINI
jgi:protein-tyrosine phosphatase